MKQKLYGVLLICTLLLISNIPSSADARNSTVKDLQPRIELQLQYSDEYINTNSTLDEKLLAALEGASPEALVSYNQETGLTTVTELKDKTGLDTQTEPYIPQGLEVAVPEPNISPFGVIGNDNRSQITNVNVYPYSTMVYLEINFGNGKIAPGTGTLVGNNLILTAGHCVYFEGLGWAQSIVVKPGGSLSSFSSVTTSDIHSVVGWVNNLDDDYDYGVIRVSSNIGQDTGYLGTRSYSSNSSLNGKDIYQYGYPLDKSAGTLWYDTGTISSVSARRFNHNADTVGGNSGGPVVLTSDWQYIVGIHTQQENSNYNSATRIVTDIINYLNGF